MQKHGSTNDYGVFVVKFLEHVILGRPILEIEQSKMKAHRKEIGYSLPEFCEKNHMKGSTDN